MGLPSQNDVNKAMVACQCLTRLADWPGDLEIVVGNALYNDLPELAKDLLAASPEWKAFSERLCYKAGIER